MGFTEGQTGHLAKHDAIDTLTATHTSQIAAGDVTNPASAARIVLSATFAAREFQVAPPTNNAAIDLPNINAQITAASAVGGTVQLQAGTYFVDAAITALANGVTVRGRGPYATVIRTSSLTADVFVSSGASLVGIRDLQIESLIARTAGAAISFTNVTGYVIDNLRLVSPYNCGTFTGCHAGWITRVKIASGPGVLNRGLWFQSSVDTHLQQVLINGGAVTLGAGKAWVHVDSGCDTFTLLDCVALASSGSGIGLLLSHSLGGASFAPRWIKAANFLFEGSSGVAGQGAQGIRIEDCLSAYFTNGYVATSDSGVYVTAGRDIRFSQTIIINSWLYGAALNGVAGPNDVTFTDCTFSDNSAGGNGAAPHMYVSPTTTGLRVTNCTFSNDTLGNANKTTYAVESSAASAEVRLTGNRFKVAHFVTGAIGGTVKPQMRANQGYNPVGSISAPAVPATGVGYVNAFGVDCSVYIVAGTVSAISINGTATGLTSGLVRVLGGATIAVTYSVAPTWNWFGE